MLPMGTLFEGWRWPSAISWHCGCGSGPGRPSRRSALGTPIWNRATRARCPVWGFGPVPPGSWREVSPRWVVPDEPVDRLSDEVGMAVVPRVLLDHVDQDVAQTG